VARPRKKRPAKKSTPQVQTPPTPTIPRRVNPVSGPTRQLLDRPMKVTGLNQNKYLGTATPVEELQEPPTKVKQKTNVERTTDTPIKVNETTNVERTTDVEQTTDVERIIPTEFTCFPRLPIELRYKIWYCTLKPRLVMLENPEKQDTSSSNLVQPSKIYCRTPLPIALQVSRDSRNAVLPMYPLCFHSETLASAIRFNFSLDTLYWNVFESSSVFTSVTTTTIFDFLEQLNPIETASLQNIAIDGQTGVKGTRLNRNVAWKFWVRLATALEKLHGLRNILTVHDIMWVVYEQLHSLTKQDEAYGSEDAKDVSMLIRLSDWYRGNVPSDKRVDLFDEFPSELNKHVNLTKNTRAMPIAETDERHVHALHANNWLNERTSHIHGWWRPKVPRTWP
jgi:hypothetical protein